MMTKCKFKKRGAIYSSGKMPMFWQRQSRQQQLSMLLLLLLSDFGLWPVHLQNGSRAVNFLRGIVAGGTLTGLVAFTMLPLARTSCPNGLAAGSDAGGGSFLMYEVKI